MEGRSPEGHSYERKVHVPSFEKEPNPEKEPQPPYTIPHNQSGSIKIQCTVYKRNNRNESEVIVDLSDPTTFIEGLTFSQHADAVKVTSFINNTNEDFVSVLLTSAITKIVRNDERVFFLNEIKTIRFKENGLLVKEVFNFHILEEE